MREPETDISKPSILIVDDTLENLRLLTNMLAESGYSVTGAPDGPTAMMIARNNPPDLILLDILMPGMDGYEVCGRLKIGERTSHIPVIFLSALNDVENKVKGFQAGGVDFITKPFQHEEITARIDTHLKLRNFQRRLEEKNTLLQTEIAARTRAEEALKKHGEQLETLVAERTAELVWENRLNERLAAISAELLSADYDIRKTAGLILNAARELTGSSAGYVSEINPETGENVAHVVDSPVSPTGRDGDKTGLWGHPPNTGKAFYSNEPKKHPASEGLPEGHLPIERFLSVPVFLEGKLTGQITLVNSPKNYTDKDLGAIQRLSDLYALAIRRCQYEREEENLKQQIQKSQRLEAIGTLAGGIAHDFNNILYPILGYTEILLEDSPEGSDFENRLNQILMGGQRAKELVRQILTFCRQADQKIEPLRIHLIVKEVLKLMRAMLPSTIEIRQDIEDCGTVLADPTQIHQMAMNLITNSFHAMEERGGELTVRLYREHLAPDDITEPDMLPGDYVCLRVADTGAGMDKAVMEHIFDPYFTTKEQGKGTGLGLAVVHGIVKTCYGGIRVSSDPGQGSEFLVFLPQSDTTDLAEPIHQSDHLPGGNEHILVVDDELPILTMLKHMLRRLGYEITTQTSSTEALEIFTADSDHFDLIITDFTMPHLTGVGFAEKVLSVRPDIPIIMCSGFSEHMNAEKAKAIGIREYMLKPVIKSDLSRAIRRALDSRPTAKR